MKDLFSLLSSLLLLLLLSGAPARAQWSVDLNGTREVQYGTFIAPCGCTFQPSAGWGFDAAIRHDFAGPPDMTFGAAAGLHYMHYVTYENPGNTDSSDLARIGMTYVTLEPSIRWTLFDSPLSLRLGANVGYLVSNRYAHETHPIADPEEDVDSSMGDLRPLRVAARLSAGYAFGLGDLVIVPTLGAELPLTTIRETDATDWRVISYLAGVSIRFR